MSNPLEDPIANVKSIAEALIVELRDLKEKILNDSHNAFRAYKAARDIDNAIIELEEIIEFYR
jgi:hypothetical protein